MRLRKINWILSISFFLGACGSGSSKQAPALNPNIGNSPQSQIDLSREAHVRFKLTDAPNKDLKSVVINIDRIEVLLAGSRKSARLVIAQNKGLVDLLTLQNGVTLSLQDVVIPHGIEIQQIRMILKKEGHFAVKADSSLCELKTPSAQKTGVKINLVQKFQFEAGHDYSIVIDFDALKSVVVAGNGKCLLKPVMALKSATRAPIVPPTEEGRDGIVTGPGEVLIPTPEQNDSNEDGWDSTIPSENADVPVMNEQQLKDLNSTL